MTILGWVNIGVGYAMVMYMWYMCVCFWKMLHVASADQRRVTRALATLPTLKFKGKTATAMGAPLLASDGGEPDVGESCAICLSEYEVRHGHHGPKHLQPAHPCAQREGVFRAEGGTATRAHACTPRLAPAGGRRAPRAAVPSRLPPRVHRLVDQQAGSRARTMTRTRPGHRHLR